MVESTVLVVDDETAIRDMLRMALEIADFRCIDTDNIHDAYTLVVDERPDIILLDLMMPVMDGFEFANEIRKHDEYRSIPIIVVTAKSLDDQDKKRLQGSVQRIIQKGSIGRQDLLDQIGDILAKTSNND